MFRLELTWVIYCYSKLSYGVGNPLYCDVFWVAAFFWNYGNLTWSSFVNTNKTWFMDRRDLCILRQKKLQAWQTVYPSKTTERKRTLQCVFTLEEFTPGLMGFRNYKCSNATVILYLMKEGGPFIREIFQWLSMVQCQILLCKFRNERNNNPRVVILWNCITLLVKYATALHCTLGSSFNINIY